MKKVTALGLIMMTMTTTMFANSTVKNNNKKAPQHAVVAHHRPNYNQPVKGCRCHTCMELVRRQQMHVKNQCHCANCMPQHKPVAPAKPQHPTVQNHPTIARNGMR